MLLNDHLVAREEVESSSSISVSIEEPVRAHICEPIKGVLYALSSYPVPVLQLMSPKKLDFNDDQSWRQVTVWLPSQVIIL